MPSLKIIRKRITSVQSTRKITRAMKLVAAARLRKAQDKILAARPYAVKLHELISELALRADAHDHPLLAERPPRRVMLLVVTSDRGLCGAFNTNVLRATEKYIREHRGKHEHIELAVIGRKGRDYLRHRKYQIDQYYPGLDINDAREKSYDIAKKIIESYLDSRLDMIYLVYNEFKSAMQQRISFERLLPIKQLQLESLPLGIVDFKYEPSKLDILNTIMPLYVEVEVLRAALESTASEFGARMTAMDAATSSAEEMISSLTLEYNKARQATITKELLEIVAGAEALRKA